MVLSVGRRTKARCHGTANACYNIQEMVAGRAVKLSGMEYEQHLVCTKIPVSSRAFCSCHRPSIPLYLYAGIIPSRIYRADGFLNLAADSYVRKLDI